MSFTADILIRDINERPVAVVEVKNRENLTRDIAIEFRCNLLEDAPLLDIPYFLLVSQDIGFLWKQSDQSKPDEPPTLEFPMNLVVERYFPAMQGRLRESELAIVVLRWLAQLSWKSEEATIEPEKALASSGFIQAVHRTNALVEVELYDRVR
jgi:hypothetical protein